MAQQFIIQYDNGESWDDHRRYPLFVVRSKPRAQIWVARWLKWVEVKKTKLEALPLPVYDDFHDEAEQNGLIEARETYLKALRPPRGITELIGMVGNAYGGDSQSSLLIEPITQLR